ncbi:MAG: endonuclease NucS domain-containing protein, partial [Pseudomonadota bacterium]
MGTQIQTWQIIDGKLQKIETNLIEAGRTETQDLENWIESNPSIIGHGLAIIGRQVQTISGPLDLLGIDHSGSTVIVELKRDKLPREALAQAIDYASDIATWSIEKIGEACTKHT